MSSFDEPVLIVDSDLGDENIGENESISASSGKHPVWLTPSLMHAVKFGSFLSPYIVFCTQCLLSVSLSSSGLEHLTCATNLSLLLCAVFLTAHLLLSP